MVVGVVGRLGVVGVITVGVLTIGVGLMLFTSGMDLAFGVRTARLSIGLIGPIGVVRRRAGAKTPCVLRLSDRTRLPRSR